ncbi:MAG: murein biosynthesis integral membrane protein MurJ [Gemmatimonadaceae bacterium]
MTEHSQRSTGRNATLVAAGILASRIVGLVRQRVFAHYFGVTEVADAFNQAFRIPNLVQNLFGEGVLSASFIPVYAALRSRGEDDERRRVAHAIFALLAVATSTVVLLGVLFAPWLTQAIAPGFHGAKLELTIRLVRILFPGAGLFVLSAWALGVLNSHGRFFLSYASAVFWNVAMIATMLAMGGRGTMADLAVWLAWGSVAGALLQLLVQLPGVLSLLGGLRFELTTKSTAVRTVISNFGPAFVGRGVSQISAFVDAMIASLLIDGAVATLNYAQLLYMLPVSLFGMSISAAELPAMAGDRAANADGSAALRVRIETGLARLAFFVVPSAVAFLTLGDVLASLLYRTGRFGAAEAQWVWWTLGGSAVGLLAATSGRLLSSAFYAMHDTRTPLRWAVVRVALTIALGLLFALWLPKALHLDPRWGVAGLTSSAGIAAWVEFALLRRSLHQRIGGFSLAMARVPALWICGLAAAALAWGARLTISALPPFLMAVIVIGVYGVGYLLGTHLLGFQMAAALWRRLPGQGRTTP